MDKELQDKLDKFIDDFLDVPEVKQYLLLKEEIKNSKEFNKLQEDLKKSQKDLALSLGTSEYQTKKKEYQRLKEEYDTNPLVVNYYVLQEEVSYLLEELKNKLK